MTNCTRISEKEDRMSTENSITFFKKESPLSMENKFLEDFAEDGSENEEDEDGKASPLVKVVLEENNTCADCGNCKPDWCWLYI